MKFSELKINDSFDFIGPNPLYNSFFLRCRKVSARKYIDTNGQIHSIGSIKVEVYHVNGQAE